MPQRLKNGSTKSAPFLCDELRQLVSNGMRRAGPRHGGAAGQPNIALEPTPNSFRSCVASAIGRGSPRALGSKAKGIGMGIILILLFVFGCFLHWLWTTRRREHGAGQINVKCSLCGKG